MSAFERLHPALQHHVVNSLGWRELRPLQDNSIAPILDGSHSLLLAPTAGGKTEAAFFPTLSRCLTENWTGLSVIYVCPLKALLNNLHIRLQQYCQWVGRTCALWHGDISQTDRAQMLKEPPDVLLTTPESLEVMLISRRVDKRVFFANLRVVIVDELHAFAGDDRGWHLLSVLERLTRIAGREIQRIGLSATIGNPPELLDWLAGHCAGKRELIVIPLGSGVRHEVQVDYVGSIENAAQVISQLHQGEKRLVFCDSRTRVEQLASFLRTLGVETHASHSSLSADERRRAELAFSQSSNCVIVATSTLELGVDVGDLDRVIQIDAPGTVASFLQRLGRTGRRSGAVRNCLFLATDQESLIHAIAIVQQWRDGFVEPVRPPVLPMHVMVQQLMALVIQENGVGRRTWPEWLLRLPVFAAIPETDREEILQHMLDAGYLHEDQGMLWLGRTGEEEFGRKNFLELFSVFMSPPEFAVYSGREHLGSVHESTFIKKTDEPIRISLAGRTWRIHAINWKDRTVAVSPDPERGISRWLGLGRSLSFEVCRQIRRVLTDGGSYDYLSRRAADGLAEARKEFDWLKAEAICVRWPSGEDRTEIWTYAGQDVNSMLRSAVQQCGKKTPTADNFRLRLGGIVAPGDIRTWWGGIHECETPLPDPGESQRLVDQLRYTQCLPLRLAVNLVTNRRYDSARFGQLLGEKLVFVNA